MSNSFFTGSEIRLYNGAKHFAGIIQQTPALYGLTQQAADMYVQTTGVYTSSFDACRDPQTRTQVKIAQKNSARDELRKRSSLLAKVIEGTGSVSDVQRLELGLSVRKTPQPAPAPTDRPSVDAGPVVGRTVSILVHDSATPSKRGKPAGAAGALIYTFVGASYPSDLAAWRLEGLTTKAKYEIHFPSDLPGGQQVWIRAAWVNRRQEAGPLSEPITTYLQGGGSAGQEQELKIAA